MATVTGLTAERMLEIEASSVVDGTINGSGHLILTRHDGTEIDAGYVLVAVPDASDTQKGIVELATVAEVTAGTDSTRAVTPASLASGLIFPDASITQKGVVELATDTETSTGTDTTRAVTPSGLAPIITGLNSSISGLDTRIDTLEAEPGDRVQILADNSIAESAIYSSYPVGISIMSLSSSFWPTLGGFGTVVTYHKDNSRFYQEFHRHQITEYWKRTYNFSTGWTAWSPVIGNVATDQVTIVPVANTPTSITWNYGKTLTSPIRTFATAHTAVPGSTVLTVSTSSATTTSVIVWVYRTNTTSTLVNVMAVGGL